MAKKPKKETPPTNEDVSKDTVDIAKSTMTGDIRDRMLDFVKHRMTKVWKDLNEFEQKSLVSDLEFEVKRTVAEAVKTMAADGRTVIVANLDKITIKDGIKAEVSLPKSSDQRHDLFDAQGLSVLLVVADVQAYAGERAPVEIDADQGSLPVDTETPHDPETGEVTEDDHSNADDLDDDDSDDDFDDEDDTDEEAAA